MLVLIAFAALGQTDVQLDAQLGAYRYCVSQRAQAADTAGTKKAFGAALVVTGLATAVPAGIGAGVGAALGAPIDALVYPIVSAIAGALVAAIGGGVLKSGIGQSLGANAIICMPPLAHLPRPPSAPPPPDTDPRVIEPAPQQGPARSPVVPAPQ